MGVDCRLTIPAPAQIRDVADVIGALLGCRTRRKPLGGGFEDAAYCHVDGVSLRYPDFLPACMDIEIAAPSGPRSFLYHFEWDCFGNHGIMPRCRAVNIALCVAVCDFFGGSVDFSDHDDIDEDYRQPVREDIHCEGGQPWQSFQDRKLAVEPLTVHGIERYRPYAAYEG